MFRGAKEKVKKRNPANLHAQKSEKQGEVSGDIHLKRCRYYKAGINYRKNVDEVRTIGHR